MKQENLFKTKFVPAKEGSGMLFDEVLVSGSDGTVTCLGLTFDNDEARRAHFTEELRKKLMDPEFRKIEGFPIGSDEDILNLSDPPYYTACPNPWIADFIAEWEAQKPEQPDGYHYHREPFAADVSEGKNDPIYNAHSYHTKVPHKAIMRYILHYTEPGDIVFDGFCGTGMTGVAAQLCGDREVVMSLGYQVKPDGTILQEETDEDGKKVWRPFSNIGIRHAVLNDLSTIASFVSNAFCKPESVSKLQQEFNKITKDLENNFSWMYQTKHVDGRTGSINYTVWSDVFACPDCGGELVFWNVAVNHKNGGFFDEIACSHCGACNSKNKLERKWVSVFDQQLATVVEVNKVVPVLINYSIGSKRFDKSPDDDDLRLLEIIQSMTIEGWFPTNPIPKGDKTAEPIRLNMTNVHQFYTHRNLMVLAFLRSHVEGSELTHKLFAFTSTHQFVNKLCRLNVSNYFSGKGGKVDKPLDGTLYVPSISIELNVIDKWRLRSNLKKSLTSRKRSSVVSNASSTFLNIRDESVDYIFLDPPFGGNLQYSELNFLWESWLKVLTNTDEEAVENRFQNKSIDDYRRLIKASLSEAFRILMPGRWLTVEFSNTKAAVWNSIQQALSDAGFIIANVSALDKKKGSFKAVTTPTAVKKDLVISAYKPNGGFEERFPKEAQSEEGVWDFVRTHLKYLPVTKQQKALLQFVPERDPRILFDQMIAYYVRKGYSVPIDSHAFQMGLSQRFSERDGMYFLPEQVAEYDRKKMIGGGRLVQQSLSISGEASAIDWLRNLLRDKPQSFQDINPQFMKEISNGWSKHEVGLELSTLLEQNFLYYDGKGPVPEQIHSYLSTNWKDMRNLPKDDPALIVKAKSRWYVPDPNKPNDLEKVREKALLKEFEAYRLAKKKLKIFRLEAVRTGFKKAWQERDYATIVAIAEKIPNNVLEEDPKLLMWYDQAVTRMGVE